LRLPARRGNGDILENRGDAELKLKVQIFARREMQDAPDFAKAAFLHADNIIGSDNLIECETSALIC
jgi:hypothetical protein